MPEWQFSPRPNQAHRVQWRAWGPSAFQQAQQHRRLVVLYVHAFWCAVCQRMDEGAFSHPDVQTILNGLCMPIRVQEAHRPDVDLRYSQNGWPTVVFLTPEGQRLLSVNFLEAESFIALLTQLVALFQDEPERVAEILAERAEASSAFDASTAAPLTPDLVDDVRSLLRAEADSEHGGFGAPNKYFHTDALRFYLHQFSASGDAAYLNHVLLTLDRLRQSPMWDAVDGGFYRYSSRLDWTEPHPEKLLADQADLLRTTLDAYVLAGRAEDRSLAGALIDYLERTLAGDPSGGPFCGCQDYVLPLEIPSRGLAANRPHLQSVVDPALYADANAHAASAYLQAWSVLGDARCRERAESILAWLDDVLWAPGGDLYHFVDDWVPQAPGLLVDCAAVGQAFVDAAHVIGEQRYAGQAMRLADHLQTHHRDPIGGYFDTCTLGPAALARPITPLAENAAAAMFLLDLAALTGDSAYQQQAEWALRAYRGVLQPYGAFAGGFGHALARLAPH
jgi:uncharacterized protein YyaL (SSP411 family)